MLDELAPLRPLLTMDDELQPEDVADSVAEALTGESFFIMPQPQVLKYYAYRASHTDVWLAGMRRLQRELGLPPAEVEV